MSLFKRNHLIKGAEELTKDLINDIDKLKEVNDPKEREVLLRRIIRELEFSEDIIKRVHNLIQDRNLLLAVIKAFDEAADLIKEFYSTKNDMKKLIADLEEASRTSNHEALLVADENIKQRAKKLFELEKTIQLIINDTLNKLDDEQDKIKKAS